MTLKENLQQYAYFTYGNNSMNRQYEREDNAKELEKIADDYAIEFAEWRLTTFLKNADQYTMKELLEIFKKEKGL